MTKVILIFLLCCSFASASADVNTRGETNLVGAIGEAFDLNNQALRYREYHYYSDDKLSHKVLYRDADGIFMVEKNIDYRSGFTTPEYALLVGPEQNRASVQWQENQLKLQDVKGAPVTMAVSYPLVIDAGFDHYVRENWLQLTAGNTLEFYFPLVNRSTLAKLRIKKSSCSYKTETDICFSLEVSNWLLRLLLDPIELGYSAESKLLRRYRGLSNIEDVQGKGMIVDIHYSYD
tara:strand:- start:4204 stop:4905 length:702 start_codon:yes stop_codon:yes gene_type:complete